VSCDVSPSPGSIAVVAWHERSANVARKKLFSSNVGLARRNEGNKVLYSVDVRDQGIQRMTQRSNRVRDNKQFFLIEASSAKQACSTVKRASEAMDSADCDGCGHRHCRACEECSVTKRYSDHWICHRCWELNPRVSNLH